MRGCGGGWCPWWPREHGTGTNGDILRYRERARTPGHTGPAHPMTFAVITTSDVQPRGRGLWVLRGHETGEAGAGGCLHPAPWPPLVPLLPSQGPSPAAPAASQRPRGLGRSGCRAGSACDPAAAGGLCCRHRCPLRTGTSRWCPEPPRGRGLQHLPALHLLAQEGAGAGTEVRAGDVGVVCRLQGFGGGTPDVPGQREERGEGASPCPH